MHLKLWLTCRLRLWNFLLRASSPTCSLSFLYNWLWFLLLLLFFLLWLLFLLNLDLIILHFWNWLKYFLILLNCLIFYLLILFSRKSTCRCPCPSFASYYSFTLSSTLSPVYSLSSSSPIFLRVRYKLLTRLMRNYFRPLLILAFQLKITTLFT